MGGVILLGGALVYMLWLAVEMALYLTAIFVAMLSFFIGRTAAHAVLAVAFVVLLVQAF